MKALANLAQNKAVNLALIKFVALSFREPLKVERSTSSEARIVVIPAAFLNICFIFGLDFNFRSVTMMGLILRIILFVLIDRLFRWSFG